MNNVVELIDALDHTTTNESNEFVYEKRHGTEGNHIYFRKKQFASFFQQLNALQKAAKFCDVTIRTSGEDNEAELIRAHKLIICSVSPYFRTLLCGGFRENEFINEITIENISFPYLKHIVDFFYTGEIDISEGNVQGLLPAAQILQVDDIVQACCIFLEHNMDANNCIGIEEFATRYGCIGLIKKAQKYMMDHCYQVIQGEEFLNMDVDRFVKFLEDDNLNISSERLIFEAVFMWTKFNLNIRRFEINKVLHVVRVHLLSPKFLKDQLENNEVLQLPQTSSYCQKISNVCDKLIRHEPITNSLPARFPSCTIYVIGGYCRESLSKVESLSIKNNVIQNQWSRCADMSVGRSGIACVTVAFYIFSIGGRINNSLGNSDSADVERFDPFQNVWVKCCPMSLPRSRAAANVIDGDAIYVLGGAHNCTNHSSVERYIVKEDYWEPVASMRTARVGPCCAVVNRLLYCIGGFDGTDRINSVEVYNPDDNNWTFIQPMHERRSGAGAATIDNNIYVVGGYDGKSQLCSVERYNVLTDQWTYVASISSPRSAMGCLAPRSGYMSLIMICGGYDGQNFVSTSEIYDPKDNVWRKHCDLTSERSGHGMVNTVGFSHT